MADDGGDCQRDSAQIIDFDRAAALMTRAAKEIGDLRLWLQASRVNQPPNDTATNQTRIGARRIIALRRARDRLFAPGLFGEPAWDLLLDLFVAESEGKRVSVSSACIAAAVPATTSLRWLNLLESQGLVVRDPDPHDRRRIYVKLSGATRDKLIALLGGRGQSPIAPS